MVLKSGIGLVSTGVRLAWRWAAKVGSLRKGQQKQTRTWGTMQLSWLRDTGTQRLVAF